jgi:hypothetical protein
MPNHHSNQSLTAYLLTYFPAPYYFLLRPELLTRISAFPCVKAFPGSVANLLFREFWWLQVIEVLIPGFRILPLKSKFATGPLDAWSSQ